MSDEAFARVPGLWSPDEAMERMLAAAADLPAPESLRSAALGAAHAELRRGRQQAAWSFAAAVLIGALLWMQLSTALSQTAPASSLRGDSSASGDAPTLLERSWIHLRNWFAPSD